jgi:N-acetylglucosaminyl-diphospho-decaprenol L-rhamnosyltransferase
MGMISVIIVSFNTVSLLRKCLSELFAHSQDQPLEVFVVDNNSHDNSAAMVKEEFPQVNLMVNHENLGFAAANNQAWKESTGEYVLLLNPDAFTKPGALQSAVQFMDTHPECGLCGGRLVKPDGTLDPSARKFPTALSKFFTISGLRSRYPQSRFFSGHEFGDFDHKSVLEVDWVPGTFTLYRREMLEKTGLFDERFYIYYEETDLCQSAKKAGWKVYFLPSAEVVHVGGASSKTIKKQIIDEGASQVLKFRLRSEWLYFRKNSGIIAVMTNAGTEIGWHVLRWLVNYLPGKTNGKLKREASASIIREIFSSLRITRLGGFAPPIPW